MASNGFSTERHVKLLKRQRALLVKQLPDLQSLLQHLSLHFSAYEKAEILKQRIQAEKAEKFLDIMEYKPVVVYQEFLRALHTMTPDLAVRLEGLEREVSGGSAASSPGSNDSSPRHLDNGYEQGGPPMIPVQEGGRPPIEDAGIFGLSGRGVGPEHHLSRMGYSDREFLAKRLNGDRPMFCNFCQAMGVENRLIQSSSRSKNPTAYLIQQLTLSSHPEATFSRLEQALHQIGQGNLYRALSLKMENDEIDMEVN